MDIDRLDEELHAADIEMLEKRIMELALEATGARNGAIFLWDTKRKGLVLDFHVVEGLIVNLPDMLLIRRQDGRPNGLAFWVLDNNRPCLCHDTTRDPDYARYFLDVLSIASVPIQYQKRAIGVIAVSSLSRDAFTEEHIEELRSLAESSSKFLRRAQLYRSSRETDARPFLIKGLSQQWLQVERRIERVAPTNAPVLVHGESGTGKELVAHAIHFNSRRASRPFVTVNCAAIPETMFESILFGHVRGAFTGASFDKVGEFHKADGGTLFLDEVGELPVLLQAKVLRAIEQGEVQPLGSNRPADRVDVRLICATNRDLASMVSDGRFRGDLYYRLSVMTMELPPLRSYKHNLEIFAQVFLHQASQHHRRSAPRLSTETLTLMKDHDFPGNVRELKNMIEHAVIMAEGEEIRPSDLPEPLGVRPAPAGGPEPGRETLRQMREAWLAPLERRYLADLLEGCRGNVREAASRAGVNAVTMYRLLRKRGIRLGRRVEG
jgi:transcriptional regulator with GAF, ATPase, and Fis domain